MVLPTIFQCCKIRLNNCFSGRVIAHLFIVIWIIDGKKNVEENVAARLVVDLALWLNKNSAANPIQKTISCLQ